MVMRALREGAFAGFLKYILLSLLGLSVLGLVLMDVSGAFSGGLSGNRDVAVIEGNTISLNDFDQTLRRTLEPMGINPQQAYQIGYTREILGQEIRGYLAMIEAQKMGVNISNNHVKDSIAKAVKPIIQEGQTLQQAFDLALRQRQMTEQQFVKGIRKELTADFVTQTIERGFSGSSDALAEDIVAFQTQTRDVDLLIFKDDEITEIVKPSEDQLLQLYSSLKDNRFMIPEYRTLKVGLYVPPADETPPTVDDIEAEDFYKQNLSLYEVSEQKIVTQALLSSEAEASDIYRLTQDGQTLEAAFTKIKGNASGLSKEMKLEIDVMFPDMKKALESAAIGTVVSPIKTPLGFHVMRLEGNVPAMTRTFDEVKENIKTQLLEEKKQQKLYDISKALEEYFIDGGKLSDSSDIAKLQIIELPLMDATGLNKEAKDAFSGLNESIITNKSAILEAGFAVLPDDIDHTRMINAPDGSFMAVEMVRIEPQSAKPFESVRAEILKQFEADQRAAANAERITTYAKDLREGKTDFKTLSAQLKKTPQSINGITVSGALTAPLNDEIRPALFKEPIGSYLEFKTEGLSAVIHIRDFKLPPLSDEQKKQIEAVSFKMDEELKSEAVMMYLGSLGNKYDALINDTLLKRAYGQPVNKGTP